MLRRLRKKCYSDSPLLNSPSLSFATLQALLEQRTAREQQRLLISDGLRFVHAALSSPYFRPEAVFYSPSLATHPSLNNSISDTRAQIRARNIPEIRLTPEQFLSLAQAPEPQGIGVVVRIPDTSIRYAPPDAGLCWLAIDTIRSPGNLGTIMRTAEAVGAAGIICIGDSKEAIDPFAPTIVRTSMGAVFHLRIVQTTEAAFAVWREKHGVLLVGTSPHEGGDFRQLAYPERVALWLGSERKGMGEAQMAACDALVRIPMVGRADSLNVATATAVMLYEVQRQRGL
jgi:RNA methyltransferase, TrmH family